MKSLISWLWGTKTGYHGHSTSLRLLQNPAVPDIVVKKLVCFAALELFDRIILCRNIFTPGF